VTTLPTIDLRQLSPGAGSRDAALAELRATVASVGAFYLVGHEVPIAEADEILHLTRRFFALPERERRSIEMVNSPHFRGYTALGNEYTQGQPDWRAEVDIGAERPARRTPEAPSYWGLQGPNQWPRALPELRPAVLEWIERLRRVAADLAKALTESLGLAREYFDDAFAPDPHLLVKLIRYPGRADEYDRQGVGTHRDSGFLTLVLQDDRGGSGLQFFDGTAWIDVVPKRGAFVINLGEALELATAHRLRATLHRVQSPPADRDYFSVPFFFNPRFDYVVTPLNIPDHIIAPRTDEPPVLANDAIFAEYGYNALKSRLRSHRDVAQRYYADVAQPTPA
jgi:isopenicillin N synthase-like dioxygenase